MTAETMTEETNRAQVVDCEALVSVLRLGIAQKEDKLLASWMQPADRYVLEEGLRQCRALLTATEFDLATARAALNAVPNFIDDEKTAPRIRLVHSGEPETMAEHDKPSPCGRYGAHSDACTDCRDLRLEKVVSAMGGRDVSYFVKVQGSDADTKEKRYQYTPPEAQQDLGFVCTWLPRPTMGAALLDYIRGYRDWNNRSLGDVQS